jgi:hypothetical protein
MLLSLTACGSIKVLVRIWRLRGYGCPTSYMRTECSILGADGRIPFGMPKNLHTGLLSRISS